MIAGPDLTPKEHSTLMRVLKRSQDALPGLRTHGMSAGAARAYIKALCDRADQAEREQTEEETDG